MRQSFSKFIKETIITGIAYWTLNLKEIPHQDLGAEMRGRNTQELPCQITFG